MSSALSPASASHPHVAGVSARRCRVLVLASHVVQYASPLFRLLAKDPRLDVLVAYCSLQGAEPGLDPEFGREIQWDVPLLDGYPWVHVHNKSLRPRLGHFFGLWNPGLWKVVRTGGFDAVVIYTGYMFASFWLTVLSAKSQGIPVIISIDSTTLRSRDRQRWKEWIKPWALRGVFSLVDVIMAASNAARTLAIGCGIADERIRVIRAGADKEAWTRRISACDRAAMRRELSIPEDAPVVLYCAKLQSWKRPLDLLRAFAKASVSAAYLVFAGDGPQRSELEAEVRKLGLEQRVRMLGFVNVSRLPCFYSAADLFVLPSGYDPCPLVVTEAMFSGLPVVMSDAVLGRLEMVDPGSSGYLYPSGDVDALAAILKRVLLSRPLLEKLKAGVSRQMESWTAEEFLDCWVGAVEAAVRLKQNPQESMDHRAGLHNSKST